MLEIGAEISCNATDGKEIRSRICLFVSSPIDETVYAVTSAAFANSATETILGPDRKPIGTKTEAPEQDAQPSGTGASSADLFGLIRLNEDAWKTADHSPDLGVCDRLDTTQWLYLDTKLQLPICYVSIAQTEISLPHQAFSDATGGSAKNITVANLGLAKPMPDQEATPLLSGTPLFARPGLVAAMAVAGTPEQGYAVVPMGAALRENGLIIPSSLAQRTEGIPFQELDITFDEIFRSDQAA